MILCASPDPKELHKTISTLEYGAKAKCIVRGPHTPLKEKGTEDSSSTVILGSRIAVMDQFIHKLQMENKLKEKERNEAQKELMKREEEIATLRAKLELVQGKGTEITEEQINLKVNERTQMLKSELEMRIQECQKMANEIVEMERRKMEERMFQQQQEFEMLRRRLEDMEVELRRSKAESGGSVQVEENAFAKRLQEIYSDDAGMVKSMDLDRSIDMDAGKLDVLVYKPESGNTFQAILGYPNTSNSVEVEDPLFTNKVSLSTVFEEDEEDDDEGDTEKNLIADEEVQKEVIEEKTICSGLLDHDDISDLSKDNDVCMGAAPSRQALIQNIFTLCGNYRELPQHAQKKFEYTDSSLPTVKTIGEDYAVKDFHNASVLAAEGFSETIKKSPVNQTGAFKSSYDSKENFNPLNHLPFTPLENKLLPSTPLSNIKEVGEHLSRTPFVTVKRYLNESVR